jgi:microcystin-dependent protein
MRKLGALVFLLLGGGTLTGPAQAGPEPYIGQVIPVAENFCPRGYLRAAGQTLAISQYQTLFSLLGCTYGGDCRTTFALPDMRGTAMIGAGNTPGMPVVQRGARMGGATYQFTEQNMPEHRHDLRGDNVGGGANSPAGTALPTYTDPTIEIYSNTAPSTSVTLHPNAMGTTGSSSVDVSLYQPSQAVNMCIAVDGLYPPRN